MQVLEGVLELSDLNYIAIKAASDEKTLNELIKQSEFFILKCASSVTHRYITKSDDEWSLALLAFSQAVKNYNLEKGGFLSFAELVIKRRLIDYCRTRSKYNAEIPVNPIAFSSEWENEEENYVYFSVVDRASQTESESLKLEIEAANQIFKYYGFSFYDLADCSPKAEKTKTACARSVAFIFKNPALINEIRILKQLPLKIITENVNIPRKLLERHRKYIIAAIEILSGEFPYLSEYMRFIRKEL